LQAIVSGGVRRNDTPFCFVWQVKNVKNLKKVDFFFDFCPERAGEGHLGRLWGPIERGSNGALREAAVAPHTHAREKIWKS
jgi:hypothetical protein